MTPLNKYPVITICGSMRFYNLMLNAAQSYTTKGYIVLMPFVTDYALSAPIDNQKRMLDDMHRAKINMSDTILVVADHTHYVGDSTLGEIAYANFLGKEILYSWEITDGS